MTASSSAAVNQLAVGPLVLLFTNRTSLLGTIRKVMLCTFLNVAILIAIFRGDFVTLIMRALRRDGHGGSRVM